MTVRFPSEPGFQGRFAPVRLEGEIRGVEVTQGEIPASLSGTYYRVGADPAWPPFVERDFYFNADGMVAMFRFGRRLLRLQVPVRADAALRGGAGGAAVAVRRLPEPVHRRPVRRGTVPRARRTPTCTGTAAGCWPPRRTARQCQIDPDTLDTVGEFNWDGDLSSQTATAHPKIDPRDGSLVFFGYMARGETTPDIAYYEADASGKIVHEAWFEAPYSSMVHDWAVTENFVIFPIIPLTASLDRLKAGGPIYVWDGSEDVYLGVVSRRGSTVRWFRGTNRFASHVVNAYDDGRYIHIDTPVGEKSAFPWFPDITGAPFDPEKISASAPVAVDDRHAGTAGSRRRGDRVQPGAADGLLG